MDREALIDSGRLATECLWLNPAAVARQRRLTLDLAMEGA